MIMRKKGKRLKWEWKWKFWKIKIRVLISMGIKNELKRESINKSKSVNKCDRVKEMK